MIPFFVFPILLSNINITTSRNKLTISENNGKISNSIQILASDKEKLTEKFKLGMVSGLNRDQDSKVGRLNCIFEDFSKHLTICVPYQQFTNLGYTEDNIMYPKLWKNITHRNGSPCLCMCEEGYKSIQGNCVLTDARDKDIIKQNLKSLGWLPYYQFKMGKYKSIYHLSGIVGVLSLLSIIVVAVSVAGGKKYIIIGFFVVIIIINWILGAWTPH